jgi:hypothetical protein
MQGVSANSRLLHGLVVSVDLVVMETLSRMSGPVNALVQLIYTDNALTATFEEGNANVQHHNLALYVTCWF